MSRRARGAAADDSLLERMASMLADPLYREDPLYPVLAEALEHIRLQNQRLERLLRISDGYHLLERDQTLGLAERCERQIRRMEKLARISDQYQRNLLEVTEGLRRAANQDPLTGIPNRRYLMERLKEETERASRKGYPLAIAMMDVDHFKQINDRYGHEVGDTALCEIANAVRQGVRRYDIYGRWGGEEFLLLLPETAQVEAVAVLERIRQQIGRVRVGGETPTALSASFGLTLQRRGESLDETLKRADAALFAAKDAGRNRIAIEL